MVAKNVVLRSGGRIFRQALEEPHANCRRMNVAHAVHEALRLARRRLRNPWVAMTNVGDAEGRRAVDILVAVDVGHGRAACRFPKDRKIVGKERDVALLVGTKLLRERRAARTRDAHVSLPIQRTNSAMRGLPP